VPSPTCKVSSHDARNDLICVSLAITNLSRPRKSDEIMKEEKAKKLVRLIALVVFGLFSIMSAIVLFRPEGNTPKLVVIRHFGIAVTIWASLRTAFDFAMHQAKAVKAWFIGANLVTLSSVVLLCMLALRVEAYTERGERWEIAHLALVHAAVALYLVWDMIAKNYYKTEYHEWYGAYSLLMSYDLIITLAFFCAYIPFIFPGQFFGPNAAYPPGFIDGAIAFLLITEFLAYYIFAPEVRSRAVGKNILSVAEGYKSLASVYDRGNAIMCVERRHTLARLQELSTTGTIVDLGCGTGFYTVELAKHATKVIAIDPSPEMLGVLKEKLGDQQNVEIIEEPVSALRDLPPASVDGVMCCLVIDHLGGFDLLNALRDIRSVLRPGGWLYITDVNAYFEKLQQPFAKFIDSAGVAQKIQVFPHTVKEIFNLFRRAGFDINKVGMEEVLVSKQEASDWSELQELADFPLIFGYFVKT
jgi:ubiquinone/menaquinone biosynthesis C-methylase UbiE